MQPRNRSEILIGVRQLADMMDIDVFRAFREEKLGCDAKSLYDVLRGPALVLEQRETMPGASSDFATGYAWAPNSRFVTTIAFEGPGNVWIGPRKGPHTATLEDANRGLARILRHGLLIAFGPERIPTNCPVGTLFVRQAWTGAYPKGPGIRGRFGAVIRLGSTHPLGKAIPLG